MSFTCWYRPGVRSKAKTRKLSFEQELMIYRLFHAVPGAVECKRLAHDFSISVGHVRTIVNNRVRYGANSGPAREER